MIETMFEYSKNALIIFENDHIYDFKNSLKNYKTEADLQIEEYEKNGFNGLRNYLINNVDIDLY